MTPIFSIGKLSCQPYYIDVHSDAVPLIALLVRRLKMSVWDSLYFRYLNNRIEIEIITLKVGVKFGSFLHFHTRAAVRNFLVELCLSNDHQQRSELSFFVILVLFASGSDLRYFIQGTKCRI